MYVPAQFEENRIETLHQLIRDHPLGALVTLEADGLNANHIPFDVSPATFDAPHGILRAHIARSNPLWRNVDSTQNALVIFQGAQSYITPSWYEEKTKSGKVVPTYNYAVAHAYGRLRIVDDAEWLRALLERLTQRHESGREVPWKISDAPEDYIRKLTAAVVGIEIPLSRIVGKWKASQNQSDVDRRNIAAGLCEVSGENAAMMAELVARELLLK